jgi:cardiolipin synthase A/B
MGLLVPSTPSDTRPRAGSGDRSASKSDFGTRLRRRWLYVLGALFVAAVGFFVFRYVDRDDGPLLEPFELPATIRASSQAAFGSALYQTVGARLQPGNEVRLLLNGDLFPAIVEDISKAEQSIHVLSYIWEKGAASDPIVRAIVSRAEQGVECRILVDAIGSPDFGEDIEPTLEAAGCEVLVFRPLQKGDPASRDHRKIVVVDGRVAFTGGFGVRDDWLGDGVTDGAWRDTHVRFEGPAVADAQQAFAENWQEAGGDLLPLSAFPQLEAVGTAEAAFVTSTAHPVVTKAERLSQLMIAMAKHRIWIANAYFVPTRGILHLLEEKAAQGVDVRVLWPGVKDDSKTAFSVQRVKHDGLLEAGVKVWEYQPSMMHAKTMVIDDDLAVVGSINLDPLSLSRLEEAALVVRDRAFAESLARSFEGDVGHAETVTP